MWHWQTPDWQSASPGSDDPVRTGTRHWADWTQAHGACPLSPSAAPGAGQIAANTNNKHISISTQHISTNIQHPDTGMKPVYLS